MMKKKLFSAILCSLAFCSLFFTTVYSMKVSRKKNRTHKKNALLQIVNEEYKGDVSNNSESDSVEEDDSLNELKEDQKDTLNSGSNLMIIINEESSELDDQEQVVTVNEIFKLSSENLTKMSPKKLFQISKQLYEHIKKVKETITESVSTKDTNKLEEWFKILKKVQKKTRVTIDPKILIPIIEQLPGIIQTIESALENVEKQIEEETQGDQQKKPELYVDTISTLKSKQSRLKCLLVVLKPSLVVLTAGVVIGYNMGWLPVTISEPVQNYVVSTVRSWLC